MTLLIKKPKCHVGHNNGGPIKPKDKKMYGTKKSIRKLYKDATKNKRKAPKKV